MAIFHATSPFSHWPAVGIRFERTSYPENRAITEQRAVKYHLRLAVRQMKENSACALGLPFFIVLRCEVKSTDQMCATEGARPALGGPAAGRPARLLIRGPNMDAFVAQGIRSRVIVSRWRGSQQGERWRRIDPPLRWRLPDTEGHTVTVWQYGSDLPQRRDHVLDCCTTHKSLLLYSP